MTIGTSLADDGQNGTFFKHSSSGNLLKKASAPIPKNGDELVYASASPVTIALKWYSGYNATGKDNVYCDNSNPPTTSRGTVSATTRGKTVNMSVYPNKTYYMKVKTDTNSVSSDIWTFKTVG